VQDGGSEEKLVINKSDKIIKGVWHTTGFVDPEQAVRDTSCALPPVLSIVDVETGGATEVELKGAKAVFFVREFEGQSERRDLRFHQHAPTHDGVWVRLEFQDGEELEGLVYNSIAPLVEEGFFLLPTDPGSNNRLVYVMKSALKNYCVLGVRTL